MRRTMNALMILIGLSLSGCFFGNAKTVQYGKNRLQIDLKSRNKPFSAQARVYINDKFVGMTDPQGDLAIKLPRGEYAIRIALEGYKAWEETILILGKGYSQNIYPDLKQISMN